MAPAHPHATPIAVYPALLATDSDQSNKGLCTFTFQKMMHQDSMISLFVDSVSTFSSKGMLKSSWSLFGEILPK